MATTLNFFSCCQKKAKKKLRVVAVTHGDDSQFFSCCQKKAKKKLRVVAMIHGDNLKILVAG